MVPSESLVLCYLAALALMCSLVSAYSPLVRYSGSLSWPPPLYYHRATRPVYYPESDYYYPQDPYFYPSVYQSVVPAYYMDQQRPYYYGYDEVTEPTSEEVQDVPQDESNRGEYGQETWYQDNNADANARFLQNLILAQMYGDIPSEEEGDRWVYGEAVTQSGRPKVKAMAKEDEDVRELKSLVRGPDRRNNKIRKEKENMFAAQQKPKSNEWDQFRSNYKRSSSNNNNELQATNRKPKMTATTASPASPSSAVTPPGQKEVVLPRPRQTRGGPREPSVYDTIKRLLHMEDQIMDEDSSTSRLHKRSFVPSEESLVAQLGRLKKMA